MFREEAICLRNARLGDFHLGVDRNIQQYKLSDITINILEPTRVGH